MGGVSLVRREGRGGLDFRDVVRGRVDDPIRGAFASRTSSTWFSRSSAISAAPARSGARGSFRRLPLPSARKAAAARATRREDASTARSSCATLAASASVFALALIAVDADERRAREERRGDGSRSNPTLRAGGRPRERRVPAPRARTARTSRSEGRRACVTCLSVGAKRAVVFCACRFFRARTRRSTRGRSPPQRRACPPPPRPTPDHGAQGLGVRVLRVVPQEDPLGLLDLQLPRRARLGAPGPRHRQGHQRAVRQPPGWRRHLQQPRGRHPLHRRVGRGPRRAL